MRTGRKRRGAYILQEASAKDKIALVPCLHGCAVTVTVNEKLSAESASKGRFLSSEHGFQTKKLRHRRHFCHL